MSNRKCLNCEFEYVKIIVKRLGKQFFSWRKSKKTKICKACQTLAKDK